MVGASVFRDARKIIRERQALQHQNSLDNMFIDLEALFGRESSPTHREVMQLAIVEEIDGNIQLKAIASLGLLIIRPRNPVPGPIRQQRLLDR